MRYLLLHADRISFKALRPALKRPPDPPGEYSGGPAVVVFASIESGDDELIVEAAARDIVDYARNRVREERIVLYPYAHLSSDLARPSKAHKLLLLLEGKVRESFEGEVVRAPFGWYKEFEIKVKGHPLSELSRSITAESVVRLGEVLVASADDAVKAGILPAGTRTEPPMTGLAREKLGLLGVECGRWEALHYAWKVAMFAARLSGEEPVILEAHQGPPGIHGVLGRLASAVNGGLTLALAPCPLDSVVGMPNGIDPIEVLEGMGLSHVRQAHDGAPAGIIYEAGDSPVLIGLRLENGSAIGPVGSLIKSVIHYQASRAESGETPMLPIWLHPITAAVIPARKEQEEYAMSIARELAAHGARVVVLEPVVGLGARIRWAGKRWVPYVLVAGPREEKTGTVTVRRRWRPGEQEAVLPSAIAREVADMLLAGWGQGRVLRVHPS